MKSDVEIAREHVALPLEDIAKRAGLLRKELCYYGKNKAKVDQEAIERVQQNEPGKLVLVTAITPTPAGEGKTTVSIGLADGLNLKGVKTMFAARAIPRPCIWRQRRGHRRRHGADCADG